MCVGEHGIVWWVGCVCVCVRVCVCVLAQTGMHTHRWMNILSVFSILFSTVKVCLDKGDLPPLLWLCMSYSIMGLSPPGASTCPQWSVGLQRGLCVQVVLCAHSSLSPREAFVYRLYCVLTPVSVPERPLCTGCTVCSLQSQSQRGLCVQVVLCAHSSLSPREAFVYRLYCVLTPVSVPERPLCTGCTVCSLQCQYTCCTTYVDWVMLFRHASNPIYFVDGRGVSTVSLLLLLFCLTVKEWIQCLCIVVDVILLTVE